MSVPASDRFGRARRDGDVSWTAGRIRLTILVLLTAALTAVAGEAAGGLAWPLRGTLAYLAAVVVALFRPGFILAQLVVGQILVVSVLLAPGGPGLGRVIPVMALVVATAEVLGLAARARVPMDLDPRAGLRRAGMAALVGGSAFAVVGSAQAIPGPSGITATALAAAGCVLLAFGLTRSA